MANFRFVRLPNICKRPLKSYISDYNWHFLGRKRGKRRKADNWQFSLFAKCFHKLSCLGLFKTGFVGLMVNNFRWLKYKQATPSKIFMVWVLARQRLVDRIDQRSECTFLQSSLDLLSFTKFQLSHYAARVPKVES